ncbi:MAG: alpha/beta hydrolase [Spirochaetia bacterium]|nr:alpha/beta hydrolase [Spirochaetia bacterium]
MAEKYNFVCLNIDYKLSNEELFPTPLIDAKCGIQWLRKNKNIYNIDPNRIAVCGGSAGANLASLVATTADNVKYATAEYEGISSKSNAAILFNGEYDMMDLLKKGSLIEAMRDFLGGDFKELPELYKEISSIRKINSDTCPTLLLHGTKDDCVSHKQSIAFYKKLKMNGVYSELELYPEKPHAWFNHETDRLITLKRMESFLCKVFNL